MKVVEIPFHQEMKDAALKGNKTATSRNKQYGEAGDVFELDGVGFKIRNVYKLKLRFVANAFYRREGFDSPEAFKAYWNMLHPKKQFDPEQVIWFHSFERIG